MKENYHAWLVSQKYDSGTISAQMHRAGRVEKHHGDLDQHYERDRLASVVAVLQYSREDERRNRPNPSKIPFNGNTRHNLASYKNAVERYRRFRDGAGASISVAEKVEASQRVHSALLEPVEPEELGAPIGLERDMQAALRRCIGDLEPGLEIIDDGAERFVASGRIDITCRDNSGALVVIELKTGVAGQRAVAQLMSYMGDVSVEEAPAVVRGLLVASSFDRKAVAAARMVPTLGLVEYGVRFEFRPMRDEIKALPTQT